jgi:hypothetical protein
MQTPLWTSSLWNQPVGLSRDDSSNDFATFDRVAWADQQKTIHELIDNIVLPSPSCPRDVMYLQSQNGNLSGELAALSEDVPADVDFATEALGMFSCQL